MSTIKLNTGRLELRARLVEAGRTLMFLAASLPLGLAYLVTLPVVMLAGPFAIRRLLEIERKLANRLLCARIPVPPLLAEEGRIERHQVAFLAGKLPISLCAAAFCALPVVLLAELLALSVTGLTGSGSYVGPWTLGPPTSLVLLLLAVPASILCIGASGASGALLLHAQRRGLSSTTLGEVPVREALAERLGDRTLAIAYWLPERKQFVDEQAMLSCFQNPAVGGLGRRLSTWVSRGGDHS